MNRTVRLDAAAFDELDAAMCWYEQERLGLGADFLAEVLRGLTRLQLFPGTCSPALGVPPDLGVRRLRLRRFPYALVFVEQPQEIVVLAVAHGRRDAGYWRDRL